MPTITRTYLPGYTGTATLGGTDYPIQGWSSESEVNQWDASNTQTGGWVWQEAGLQKLTFSFLIVIKATNGLPPFVQGSTIAAVFNINGVAAYQGNVFITKFNTKNDFTGGIMLDVSADSQGAMTGSLAPTYPTPTPSPTPTPTPTGS